MATPSSPTPDTNLQIDIANLTGSSQLAGLLGGNAKPTLTLARSIAPFWRTQIKSVPTGSNFGLALNEDASWKTTTGIGFALSGESRCSVSVVTQGGVVEYAAALEEKTTESLPAEAYPGYTYIVIDLDFDITGKLTASGAAGPLGITGKIENYAEASVTFCHRVDGDMPLGEAVRESFEQFVFPVESSSPAALKAGDIAQINFTATLGCSLEADYGIDTVRFSAPGVASVLDSLTRGKAAFNLPSGKVDIGASARFGYTHTDAFSAVLHRDAGGALLYLMRADKRKLAEALAVKAAVRITDGGGVDFDPHRMAQTLDHIMPGSGAKALACLPEVRSALSDGVKNWIEDETAQGVRLGVEWDQFRGRLNLFRYRINTGDANLVRESLQAFCAGNLAAAASAGGLTLQQGSRVLERHSRFFTMSLQVFNLFAASGKTGFFDQSTVEVMPDGSLRYTWDIGEESDSIVKEAKKTCLIHFVTTAAGSSGAPQIDLQFELRASGNPREAGRIARVLDFLPAGPGLESVASAIRGSLAEASDGRLALICVFNPAAWRRLSASEYQGGKPPSDNRADMNNWEAFRDACAGLIDPAFRNLTYANWQQFNVASVNGPGSGGAADRRQTGNWTPGPFTNFLLNSARFMNLCDDLHRLAGLASAAADAQQDRATGLDVLRHVAWLVIRQDASTDYSKPAIAALARLMNTPNVTADVKGGKESVSCTLTLN